jgi:hypothetical protein
MFLGHFAVALAAKRAAPRTSLGTLVLAAQLADLVWPLLLLAGLEVVRIDPGNTAFTPLDFVSYPYTHSLLATALWAAAAGGIALARSRYRAGAIAVAVAVASHWVLDVLAHRPDLPLGPGGPKVGLGLWNHRTAAMALEVGLFAIGLGLYRGGFPARDGRGRWGLFGLALVLVAIYAASALGPPPPSEGAIAWAGLLTWLFVPWAAWIDRHRAPRSAAVGAG